MSNSVHQCPGSRCAMMSQPSAAESPRDDMTDDRWHVTRQHDITALLRATVAECHESPMSRVTWRPSVYTAQHVIIGVNMRLVIIYKLRWRSPSFNVTHVKYVTWQSGLDNIYKGSNVVIFNSAVMHMLSSQASCQIFPCKVQLWTLHWQSRWRGRTSKMEPEIS